MDERQIMEGVAKMFGTTAKAIKSRARTQRIAFARHIVMYLMREVGISGERLSYPVIGRILGRDHSSVIHGHAMIAARMAREPGFAATIARLEGVARLHQTEWEDRTEFERGCMA